MNPNNWRFGLATLMTAVGLSCVLSTILRGDGVFLAIVPPTFAAVIAGTLARRIDATSGTQLVLGLIMFLLLLPALSFLALLIAFGQSS